MLEEREEALILVVMQQPQPCHFTKLSKLIPNFALPAHAVVNQAIMLALFMVIIAAFIGTIDLRQEIFRALTFNDAGKGLVVGLCVAFMGLTVDSLVVEWSNQKKQTLGIMR